MSTSRGRNRAPGARRPAAAAATDATPEQATSAVGDVAAKTEPSTAAPEPVAPTSPAPVHTGAPVDSSGFVTPSARPADFVPVSTAPKREPVSPSAVVSTQWDQETVEDATPVHRPTQDERDEQTARARIAPASPVDEARPWPDFAAYDGDGTEAVPTPSVGDVLPTADLLPEDVTSAGRAGCRVRVGTATTAHAPEVVDGVGLCGYHYATYPNLRRVARRG